MSKKPAILFWSGGKDSALALYKIRQENEFEVKALISVLNKEDAQIPFHGIREGHLKKQSLYMKIPLQRIFKPQMASDIEYKELIKKFMSSYAKAGITDVIFGDIFLEDIRAFREELFSEIGFTCHFPLWNKPSRELAQEFISTGHKAIITAVMKDKLESRFLGKEYNQEFLDNLPEGVDACGENGEFHTFVSYAPYFKLRVEYSKTMGVDQGPYHICQLQDP